MLFSQNRCYICKKNHVGKNRKYNINTIEKTKRTNNSGTNIADGVRKADDLDIGTTDKDGKADNPYIDIVDENGGVDNLDISTIDRNGRVDNLGIGTKIADGRVDILGISIIDTDTIIKAKNPGTRITDVDRANNLGIDVDK